MTQPTISRNGYGCVPAFILTVAVCLAGFACGGSESSSKDAGTGELDSARNPTRDGGGSSGMDQQSGIGPTSTPGITPLPDGIAGRACDGDSDCGSGQCLTTLAPAFGGASEVAVDGYCSGPCMTNDDCGAGGTCSGAFPGLGGVGATPGRCLKACETGGDCREGYRCVTALGMAVEGALGMPDPTGGLLGGSGCEPKPKVDELEDGVVGKPCSNHADCGDGRCQRTGMPLEYAGGYCTGACLEDADCGAGASCTPPVGGGAGTCHLNCESDDDCREGYRCRTNVGLRQCIPGAPALGEGIVGNPCKDDAACGGVPMSCAASLSNDDAPGGYCSTTCGDDSDCGPGGACVGRIGGAFADILGTTGTCYRICADDAECRDGYTCGRPPTTGFVPAASQDVCFVGSTESAAVATTDDEDAGTE